MLERVCEAFMNEQDIEKLILDNALSIEEQLYLKQILLEISTTGSSSSLNNLWEADYEEIPVSIHEFITNDRYLGKSLTDDFGNLTLYPYWVDTLEQIFNPSNEIMECAFSGAIGIGKSTIAVVGMCYVLYKLLCLKNPAGYYKLNKGSKIALAFFNINMDQAYGVGYSKMQAYLKASPWFLEHGTVYGRNFTTYYPGKDIEILVGSKRDHFIGRDVFCVSGDTEILTDHGFKKIEELNNSTVNLYNQDNNGELFLTSAEVIKTADTDIIYEIELEDGTVLKCTGDHKLRLSDGSYKMVKDLSDNDDIMEV